MACSIECYKEYMKRIEESRKTPVEKTVVKKAVKKATKTSKINENKVKDETEYVSAD